MKMLEVSMSLKPFQPDFDSHDLEKLFKFLNYFFPLTDLIVSVFLSNFYFIFIIIKSILFYFIFMSIFSGVWWFAVLLSARHLKH